jgi:uncharacterized membrane protein
MNNRKSLDLIIIGTLALVTMLVAFLGLRSATDPETLPVWFLPVGLAMVLVFPGYVLVKAFLPSLEGTTVLLLSVSLSIALDIIGILALNALPWGLRPTSWAVWLGGITLLGCLFAAIKRHYYPDLNAKVLSSSKVNWRVVIPLLIAASITLISVFIARSAFTQSGTTFTQLWALPTTTEAPYKFQIGIRNYERLDEQYDLYVESQGKYIYSESNIKVASNENWTIVLSLDEKPAKAVVVYLYLSDVPDVVYRRVSIAPVAFDGPLAPLTTNP